VLVLELDVGAVSSTVLGSSEPSGPVLMLRRRGYADDILLVDDGVGADSISSGQ
jgi:hypothetical protein